MPDQFPTIEAERVPLQQVFMNLIGNAIKFTRAVRPDAVIRIAWRDVADGFEFTISDNGSGIAPEYHGRVWGIFQTLTARDRWRVPAILIIILMPILPLSSASVSVGVVGNFAASSRAAADIMAQLIERAMLQVRSSLGCLGRKISRLSLMNH
jgi:light-regulated signal transduction histidine kinase (bacteriophytochrome)